MQNQQTCERRGSRPSAAGGGGAPAPALRPSDHRSKSKNTVREKIQLLLGERALLPPSPRVASRHLQSLIPASRDQDHTPLPSAASPVVLRKKRPTMPRPSHPAPTSVTIASAPLAAA